MGNTGTARPLTLAAVVEEQAHLRGDAPALVTRARSMTYLELAEAAGRCAAQLEGLGVRAGMWVALLGRNDEDFVIAALASAKLGAVLALPPSWATPAGMRAAFELTRPAVTVYARSLEWQEIAPGTQPVRANIWQQQRPTSPGGTSVDPLSPAVAFATSGTTGGPRLVLHSHASLLRTLVALQGAPASAAGQQSWLTAIPLETIGGFSIMCRVLGQGDRLLLQHGFHPRHVLETIALERVTCLALTPAMLSVLLRVPNIGAYDLSTLGIVGVGASRLHPSLARDAADKTGALIVNSYGSTELGGPVLISYGDTPYFEPLPGVDVAVLQPDGTPAEQAVVGELACKVDNFMLGYIVSPQTAEPALDAAGWYRTGDLAFRSDDGIRLLGRVEEVADRGGRKVSLSDIEDTLMAHAAVNQAAVVSVDRHDGYDVLCAFVVPFSGAVVTAGELRNHCKAHLPNYQQPDRVSVVERLPTTLTGKVRRSELARGQAEAGS